MLSELFYCGVVIFFFGAFIQVISAFAGGRRLRSVSFAAYAFASVIILGFSVLALFEGNEVVLGSYLFLPSFGFGFFVDRLSAFFTGLIAVVSFCVSLYSIPYVEHGVYESRKNVLTALMGLFILSMILVVTSSNTFSFLFFWEIMSFTSFLLVVYEYDRAETQKAGVFYFIMSNLGVIFLFVAFIILYQLTGSFDMRHVVSADPLMVNLVFACLFIGFGMKAGIIPLHKWLPYAHPASPSNISALMSGVMIKVAIYGLIRFIIYVIDPTMWWGILILVFGTLSAILGVIYAMKEHDIKRLLAYHSIENIGIILIGFGLYVVFSISGFEQLATLSLLGSLLHTLNHAVFKSLLFLSAGSVVNATGTRNIESMGGLIHRMPYTAVIFLVGAVSISALPPFNGFVSELMIFQALMQSHVLVEPLLKVLMIFCLSIFALTSALAAACFVKAFGITFLAVPRSENAGRASEAPYLMILGPGILAFTCLILGLFPGWILSAAGYDLGIPDMLSLGAVLIASYGVVFVVVYFSSSHKSRIGETWGCGIFSQNCRMEYTASGFSEPIMTIFKSVYRTEKSTHRTFFDRYGSVFKEGDAEIHLIKFFEQYMYLPVAYFIDSVASRVSKLQNGHLDSYISYSFVAILALLVVIGWFL